MRAAVLVLLIKILGRCESGKTVYAYPRLCGAALLVLLTAVTVLVE